MIGFLLDGLGVVLFVAGGVYAAAVLDRLFGRLVARRGSADGPAPGSSSVRSGRGSLLAAPFREAALLLAQQRTRTERPDFEAWALAPALLAGLAMVAAGSVPLAAGHGFADAQGGIVLFGAAMALVMVCVFLHGWSSNSVPGMVGGYRFIAQALSFEMPLALVLIGVALPAESLAFGDIVRSQIGELGREGTVYLGQVGLWNLLRQPLGLPLYLVAALGVSFQGPLRIPDGADLAGGTRAEVSGSALLAWRLARGAVLVAVSAVGAASFLGGWSGPWLPGAFWTVSKTLLLLALMVASGHLVARLRLERFVVISWAVLIPLALVDVFVAGITLLVEAP